VYKRTTLGHRSIDSIQPFAMPVLLVSGLLIVSVLSYILFSHGSRYRAAAVMMVILSIGALPRLLHHLLNVNKIAHLIWIEDVGDGYCERCGAGEMSYSAFLRAKQR
jgi:hypothetical protein